MESDGTFTLWLEKSKENIDQTGTGKTVSFTKAENAVIAKNVVPFSIDTSPE